MRVLVTGSDGFVGRYLMQRLQTDGDETIGLTIDTDIRDVKAITDAVSQINPDAICHLAAQASVANSWKDAADTYSVNVVGVVNLLGAACGLKTLPKVLIVSSAEVYGTVSQSELPVTEGHPVAPLSPYASSKACAEIVARQFYASQGLPTVCVRPFNHIGPGQAPTFVVSAFGRQIAEAKKNGIDTLKVGNLDIYRDFTDVRDVVNAYSMLLHNESSAGETFNVCSGVSHRIADIANQMLEISAASLKIESDPTLFRPVDVSELRGDCSKLESLTGWKPQYLMQETLSDVLAYWEKQP